jgi:hypothetical protein
MVYAAQIRSPEVSAEEIRTGYRRNSEVWDKNTRRGGGSLGITHSIPALTPRENTNSQPHVLRARTAPPSSQRRARCRSLARLSRELSALSVGTRSGRGTGAT